jgi:hypothetical protein
MLGRSRSFRRAKFLPATFLLMLDREWNHSRASDEIPKNYFPSADALHSAGRGAEVERWQLR